MEAPEIKTPFSAVLTPISQKKVKPKKKDELDEFSIVLSKIQDPQFIKAEMKRKASIILDSEEELH